MKYLRKFNEATESDVKKLSEFVDEHLAYLSDKGYKFEIDYNSNQTGIYIYGKNIRFNYDSMKDDFIPFMQVLSKKYIISNIIFKEAETKIHKFVGNIAVGLKEITDDSVNVSVVSNIIIILSL